MAIELLREAANLIKVKNSVKLLATVDEQGIAHVDEKEYLELREDGKIQYLELLETARSYKNFTRSLWFNQKISLTIIGEDKTSYRIIGKPEGILVSGALFEIYYKQLRDQRGDVDLAAVCVIDPLEIQDITLSSSIALQDEKQPVFKHLDRILKK